MKMLFLTITATLLSGVLAGVASPRASCAPTSYELTQFSFLNGEVFAAVDFVLNSNFANTAGIDDAVINGSRCRAEGASIPNSNACNAPDRKLLFDLRGPQETTHYQITHTWVCNGQTWMSGNDVQVGPLVCDGAFCHAAPQTFVPQNVVLICDFPSC